MYVQVGEFRVSWIISTVPLTWFLHNTLFFKKQNARNAGNRCKCGPRVFIWPFKTLSSNVPCRTLAVVTHRVTEGLTCGLGHLCSNPSKMDCEIAPAQLTALANYLFWYTKIIWNWRWNLFSTNLGWLTLPAVSYPSLELTTHSISNSISIMWICTL